MTKRLKGVFIVLVCVLALCGCKESHAQQSPIRVAHEEVGAGEYKFVSKDFFAAVKSVNADYFFIPELPEPYDPQNLRVREDLETPSVGRSAADGEHYEILGKKLCQPIIESYVSMMAKKVSENEAFVFDSELTKAMRSAGAYVLPLLVVDGNIKGTYKISNLGQFKNDFLALDREKRLGDVQFDDKNNMLTFKAMVFDNGSGSYPLFPIFQKKIDNAGPFETEDFDYFLKFTRRFLFVFSKDQSSINSEKIYYYIDFPYEISGNGLGKISGLQFNSSPRLVDQVRCVTLSKSGMFFRGISTPNRFIDEGMAVAPITDVEPLSIPLHPEYSNDKVRRKDGKRGFEDNFYELSKAEISEPSLQCWMFAFGLIGSDVDKCRNAGYADEFLNMLNSNICVWKDKVTMAPEVGFPITVNAALHKGDYSNLLLGFQNRCNLAPHKKENK